MKCIITNQRSTNNFLLERIIKMVNNTSGDSNQLKDDELSSTLILHFVSNTISITRDTFKLILMASVNFENIFFSNVKHSLFISFFNQLSLDKGNIKTLKAVTHLPYISTVQVYCFSNKDLFNVKISIEVEFSEGIERFLRSKKFPYTIYFSPYNKISPYSDEVVQYNDPNKNHSRPFIPLLSNPRFIEEGTTYINDALKSTNTTQLTTSVVLNDNEFKADIALSENLHELINTQNNDLNRTIYDPMDVSLASYYKNKTAAISDSSERYRG